MPTFNHLGLLCSLDRIQPLDKEAASGFGATFSASFVPPRASETGQELGANDPVFLRPWNWKVQSFQVWGRAEGGPWTPIATPPRLVLVPAQTNPPAESHPLLQAVKERIDGLAQLDPDVLLWDPLQGEPAEAESREQLRHMLAVLSTRATPVPHALGLSYLLRSLASDLSAFSEVVAAPVFGPGSSLGERGPQPSSADPSVPEPPQEQANGIFTIKYRDVTGKPALVAYVLPVKKEVPSSGDLFLDLASGWVKRDPKDTGDVTPWFGTDWTLHLEGRLAEGFDLAQRLIDVLRENLEKQTFHEKLAAAPLRLHALRLAVLATVRDLAGVGLRQAPDGANLVEEVRRGAGESAVSIDWRKVETALRQGEGTLTLEAWARLVAEQVPTIAGIAAIASPSAPRPVEQLADELAELERLQSALADEDNLRGLVLAQWQRILSADAELAPALAFLERHLAEIPPRRRLARSNLGTFWRSLVDLDRKDDERVELEKRVSGQLERSLDRRFFQEDDEEARQPRLEPTHADALRELKPEILASFQVFARQLAKDSLPPRSGSSPEEGDGSPTPVPHGVTLQLDRLGAAADPIAELEKDRQDLQRRIAGFGVLLREAGKEWRCLNMARLVALPESAATAIHEAAIVPLRLGYRNGMRETSVTYNNHPLVAESPASGLANGFVVAADPHDLDRESLLGHAAVRPAPADDPLPPPVDATFHRWARLPALQFGRRYEALPFAVFNSGVLPKELALENDPTWPRTPDRFTETALGDLIRKFRYLRRVRVGPPRYFEAFEKPVPRELLPIPASVAPIAREIKIASAPEGESLPLLLLTPPAGIEAGWPAGRSEFAFPLRKPATDINTWDRWIANDWTDETMKKLRIAVWAWYHRNAPKELGTRPKIDLTLDDPAVEPRFRAVLSHVPIAGQPTASDIERDIRIPSLAEGEDFLKAVRSGFVTVRCGVASGTAAEMTPTGTDLLVKVPRGQVWELRIHPVLKANHFEDVGQKRFHPAMADELEKRETEQIFLAPALRLLIEVATNALAGDHAEKLWKALVPEKLGSRLAVRLHKAKAPDFPWPWISRAEIRRQVWRWNGRPLGGFPFEANPPDGVRDGGAAFVAPKVLEWEAKAFAERKDDDCSRTLASIRLEDALPLLYEEDRVGDVRALLHRFGVQVFSRYSGLGVPTPAVRAEHTLEARVKTPWRRLIHLCRWVDEVPKPRVKLVVPLTEALAARNRDTAATPAPPPCALPVKSHGAAGLLVVLNEPWYEIGGLAEELRVELAKVQDPHTGHENRPEIGPDPILTGAPWKGPGTVENIPFQADEPIGHTFDTDSGAPLFVSTSFVLRPPSLKDVDLSWNFAKLRFHRLLTGEGMVGGGDRESQKTDPYWVQFLPDASAYLVRLAENEEALPHLGIDEVGTKALGGDSYFQLLTRRGGKEVFIERPAPGPNDTARFFEVLLLTRLISDAGGQDEEKYVGLFRRDHATWLRLDGTEEIREGWHLRARVVEMQERTPRDVSDPRNLWQDLFPAKDANSLPQDAVLRIVRVSPPMDPIQNLEESPQ